MTAIDDTQDDAETDSYDIDQAIRPLIENTEYPVRIYADDELTTFEVDTAFNGREGTLEFTSHELATGSTRMLKIKLGNTFYDFVDVESDDWWTIRQIWLKDENKEIVTGPQASSDGDDVADTGGVDA